MNRFVRLLVLPVLIACAPRAHAEDASSWHTDDEGRRFRVGFDLGSRVLLGAFYDGDGGFDGGILVRERDDEGVQWKLDHAFLTGRLSPDRLTASAYRGLFLRWSKDGALTIPTSPPARILLPFDVGFDVTLGRVRLTPVARSTADNAADLTVGVVAGDLLFDFWRSYDFGSYLLLRTGVAYDLSVDRDLTTAPTHIVTPLSRVGLDLMHTWDSGRETFEARVAFSHRTYVTGTDQRWSSDADALVAYEAVLVALNDAPVSLRLEGAWTWSEASGDHDLRATVGLRLGLPTD